MKSKRMTPAFRKCLTIISSLLASDEAFAFVRGREIRPKNILGIRRVHRRYGPIAAALHIPFQFALPNNIGDEVIDWLVARNACIHNCREPPEIWPECLLLVTYNEAGDAYYARHLAFKLKRCEAIFRKYKIKPLSRLVAPALRRYKSEVDSLWS